MTYSVTLKNLVSTEDTGVFNVNLNSNNVELDLDGKTLQQATTNLSGTKSLTLQNAKIESDLVNNLTGNKGLTIENSEVVGQITNNKSTINILDNFVIQEGITSDYNATKNKINIGKSDKAGVVESSKTIAYQTINVSSGSLTMNKDGVDGKILDSVISVTNNGKLTANASNISTSDGKIDNKGIVEFTGGTNKNDITGTGRLEVTGDVVNKTETTGINICRYM